MKIWAFLSMHFRREGHLQEMARKYLGTLLLIKMTQQGKKNSHDLTFDVQQNFLYKSGYKICRAFVSVLCIDKAEWGLWGISKMLFVTIL